MTISQSISPHPMKLNRWLIVRTSNRTFHQKPPKVNYGFRGFLITRRSGSACEARMGSVSPLGDRGACSPGGERVNFRAAKFPCCRNAFSPSESEPRKVARLCIASARLRTVPVPPLRAGVQYRQAIFPFWIDNLHIRYCIPLLLVV